MSTSRIDTFRAQCPGLSLSTDPGVLESHGQDWTRFRRPDPAAVAFPADNTQVSDLVRAAIATGMHLVPSGGRTGLSGGALAASGEIVVSMDRMRRILHEDPADRLLTVQAGVAIAEVQARARELGLYYPVSFAAEGSAQVGGTIATNAGGIRVLRHGMTRERVKGLKVIDGRGRLLDLNRGLVKNASGYDLRHLMIGSEGTLGIVVEATLRLTEAPPPSRVMLLALDSMPVMMTVLAKLRGSLRLSACEFFSVGALELVCRSFDLRYPLETSADGFLLVEFDVPAASEQHIEEQALAIFDEMLERGWILDGVLSTSEAQKRALWRYREAISEAAAPYTPYKNDLSVRVSKLPDFLQDLTTLAEARFAGCSLLWYGHVGDGNLHMNVLKPEGEETAAFERRCKEASEAIYRLVRAYGGSVSAEHGIGLLKRPFLGYSCSEEEIELMRGIKQVMDPHGILNPGKLL